MKTKITFFLLLFSLTYFAQTDPCGSILNDTFDTAGALPTEWTEYSTTGSVTVANGKLKFEHSTALPGAFRTLTPITNDATFSFEVNASRNSVNGQVHLVSSTGKYLTGFSVGKGTASIKIATTLEDGVPGGFAEGTPVVTLNKDTDYNISAKIDFTTKKVNLYNGGELVYEDAPFLDEATDIAKIDIQIFYMYNNNGQFYFDNISFLNAAENRLSLMSNVGSAETQISSVKVGDKYGQYRQSDIDTFQAAINNAKVVLENCAANVAAIDQAIADIEAAKVAFEAVKVNDPVLKMYSGYGFSGEEHQIYCGYYNGGLGVYEDWAVSFKLEKGYMATFAQDVNGLGVSKVYVAQDNDLAINLPEALQKSISFIRVSPWFPVGKKGSLGNTKWTTADTYNVTWHYNWTLAASDKNSGTQFVPMSWTKSNNNAYIEKMEEIGKDMTLNHHMAFNEPDNSDQSNLTVAQALEAYPKLLASGLRIGAPGVENIQYSANNDSFNDDAWIKEFMDSCVVRGYRVDFIPAHDYVRRSKSTFIERFKALHDRYNLPIWVTEYNYGNPNMGSANITQEKGYNNIKSLTEALEETDFIERYNWYYFFGQATGIGGMTDGQLNITGQFYRDLESPAPSYIQEVYEQGVNLAVSNFEKSNVGLYPNPVTGRLLTIKYTEPSLYTNAIVTIYNVYGKEVLTKSNGANQVDVSHLSSGVYLVQIVSGDIKTTKKIIISSQN
ncbi:MULTISPECIES: glycosyl hydrolase [Polaribacter]|uniref:Glycosyl hydrolase n=1 Tax=Polaribacter sejongensis TaxID=985043 RepID=A0AAJ1QUF0_9FLAO|nr:MULTISPECIES: glycosyl hydrolase [Polaribacter]AUC21510.1 hypothetical protein BTO15_05065 [Polaribacter sejongensis]MDN3618125.1 glycosyl hydrolase [Polaribacter undariae]UWD30885.1 glycosyl hydrolase [Polaribacter undariae]